MSIKYSLISNHPTDDSKDYISVVQDQQIRPTDDIIEEMVDSWLEGYPWLKRGNQGQPS